VALEQIPRELQARPNWHSIRQDKKPVNEDPFTFNQAVAGTVDGYNAGYHLQDKDEIICLDLDHCHGESWAEEMLDWFPGTFKERSISGDGYHVWMRGKIPKKYLVEGNSGRFGRKKPGHWLEVYEGRKIMIATGDRIEGEELTEHSLALRMVLEEYFEPGDRPAHSPAWIRTDFPYKNPRDWRISKNRGIGFAAE